MLNSDRANVYRQAEIESASGRELEAVVLTRSARALEECLRNWNAPGSGPKLYKALRTNQAIWTTFQNDLRKPDHPMPRKLREDILSLSLFVDRRTFEMMCHPSPEKVEILVKINRNIASGLRINPEPEMIPIQPPANPYMRISCSV